MRIAKDKLKRLSRRPEAVDFVGAVLAGAVNFRQSDPDSWLLHVGAFFLANACLPIMSAYQKGDFYSGRKELVRDLMTALIVFFAVIYAVLYKTDSLKRLRNAEEWAFPLVNFFSNLYYSRGIVQVVLESDRSVDLTTLDTIAGGLPRIPPPPRLGDGLPTTPPPSPTFRA